VNGHRACLRLAPWILIAACIAGPVAAAPADEAAPPARERAREAFLAGQMEDAAEAWAELLRENPADGEAAEGRVRALIELDRHAEALREAREFHAAHPDSARAAASLGEALFRAGLFEEVDGLLTPVAEEADAPLRSLVILGRLRGAQGRYEDAAALLERAVAAAPEDRSVLFWAAEFAPGRAETIELLERYLLLAEGENPDRVEAARGTLRMLRELGDRQVWVVENRPARLEVPLERLRALDGRTLGFVVKVGLGDAGKPVRLLLDTGSAGLFLVERIAKKRGFEPLTRETIFGGGGDQRHVSPRGLFSRFDLEGLRFTNALATTTEQEFERRGRFHGVLGLSVFDGYLVTLDLKRGRLVLDEEASGEDGAPYWTISGQLLVRASANEEYAGLFLFDTGATTTLLSAAFASGIEGVRFQEPARVLGFGGAREGARYVRGVRVGFLGLGGGPGPLPTVDLSRRSRLTGVEISGYLGLDLLEGSRIVVDTGARRLGFAATDQPGRGD